MKSNKLYNYHLSVAILSTLLVSCSTKENRLFTDVSAKSGISFSNNINESETQNIFSYEYMYNGAGVAVGDVNNDGLQDIFFTANQQQDELYLNKGDLEFENITTAAGVGGKNGWKTGVSMADVNGDGLLDIYVCYSGNGDISSRANELFINKGIQNGLPLFKEEAKLYGLDAEGTNSNQSVFFDYDKDGDLDMFLLNHAVVFYSPLVNTYKLRHKRHPWYSNYLFRNDNGHFTDVSAVAGIAGGGNNFGLGVVASDINNDGWIDLYMTNDYEEQDFLLLNNKNGTFTEVAKESFGHISKFGMGCDVADCNNDGLMDIMVPDMWPADNYRQKLLKGPDEFDKYNILVDSGYMHQNMRNTLQLNRGVSDKGLPIFSEIGQLAGISNTDWSWSSIFSDFDNDGHKDLYITNGFWRDYSNMDFQTFTVADYRNQNGFDAPLFKLIDSIPQTRLSNFAFQNNGNLKFTDVSNNWGLKTNNVSHGAAYADFDSDGDEDLIVNNMGEKATLYRNNNLDNNNFLNIKLKSSTANTQAVGAKVEISGPNNTLQVCEQQPVRGYLSSTSNILHFGVAKDSIVNVKVYWPTGKVTNLKNVKVNQLLLVSDSNAITNLIGNSNQDTAALFKDISSTIGINFEAVENNFIDFKSELLLPWQLSKQGPKIAIGDVNNDGLDDLFIGSPKGSQSSLYIQNTTGNFSLLSGQPWQILATTDIIQSVFFDADADGDNDLYTVSGGNELVEAAAYQDKLYLNNGYGKFTLAVDALPNLPGSKSCVSMADFNNDNKPDLFIGGRLVPGRYGMAPRSFLLQNISSNGIAKFKDVTEAIAPAIANVGMVTDAKWIDINKDNLQDLIIVGEWMPVKYFVNHNDKFEDQSQQGGLLNTEGLWTSISPIDIDNDGDLDFILGNLAPNTQYTATIDEPMRLYVFNKPQTFNTYSIVSYYNNQAEYPYPSLTEMLEVFPQLRKTYFYYKQYAKAQMRDITKLLGDQPVVKLQATALSNCWLETVNGQTFKLHKLPITAQFSAIQRAIEITATTNRGTGKRIFVAGNFFPFRVQLGRQDAGRGTLLQWNTKERQIEEVKASLGIYADGDIRDVATIVRENKPPVIIISKNNNKVQVITQK